MGLLKLLNSTAGLPEEHRGIVRLMKISAGGKRRAVKLLEKALEVRMNGYSKEEAAYLIRKIAEENAYKPNFGEKFLGMTREGMVSELEECLMRVEPIKEPPRK